MDPFEILKVNRYMKMSEITKVYRKLLKENHPDTVMDEELKIEKNEKIREIIAAFNYIRDNQYLLISEDNNDYISYDELNKKLDDINDTLRKFADTVKEWAKRTNYDIKYDRLNRVLKDVYNNTYKNCQILQLSFFGFIVSFMKEFDYMDDSLTDALAHIIMNLKNTRVYCFRKYKKLNDKELFDAVITNVYEKNLHNNKLSDEYLIIVFSKLVDYSNVANVYIDKINSKEKIKVI